MEENHDGRTAVLLLSTEFGIGGTERTVLNLARALDRERYRVCAACLRGCGPIGARLEEAGVPVHYLDMRGKMDWRAIFCLRRLLRENNIDVLHSFLFHANMIGRIAARLARTPVVISSVRLCETRRLHLLWDRLTSGLVDMETCVSDEVLDYTADVAGVPREKLVAIPNGVGDEFAPSDEARARVRAELEIPDEAVVVLTVSRMAQGKGVDVLARVADGLCGGSRDVFFVAAGDGELLEFLRGEVSGGFCRVLGRRDDVADLMAAADVFFLPSRREGLPNAILEAMASALPVVAFDVPGCRRLVTDGETGLLAGDGDADEARRRLEVLVDDAALRVSMGAKARETARGQYSVEKMVRAVESLYDGLLAKKAGRAAK